jgi:hypothetical protein
MPRYFFTFLGRKNHTDRHGEELADKHAAGKEATIMAGQILQDMDGDFQPGQDEHKLLMTAATEMMHVVGEASSLLARLPATLTDPDTHAGMTFTVLRGVEPLLPGEAERRLLVERAAELARVGERVFPPVIGQLSKARDALAKL